MSDAQESADLAVRQAVEHLRAKRPAEAVKLLRPVASQQPDRPDVQRLLGMACGMAGDLVQAEAHFTQALRCGPDHAQTHYNLAVLYEKQGRQADAIDQLEQALAVEPGYAAAATALSRLREAQRARAAATLADDDCPLAAAATDSAPTKGGAPPPPWLRGDAAAPAGASGSAPDGAVDWPAPSQFNSPAPAGHKVPLFGQDVEVRPASLVIGSKVIAWRHMAVWETSLDEGADEAQSGVVGATVVDIGFKAAFGPVLGSILSPKEVMLEDHPWELYKLSIYDTAMRLLGEVILETEEGKRRHADEIVELVQQACRATAAHGSRSEHG